MIDEIWYHKQKNKTYFNSYKTTRVDGYDVMFEDYNMPMKKGTYGLGTYAFGFFEREVISENVYV